MKYYIKESLPAVLKKPAGSIAFMTIDSGSVITVKDDVSVFGFAEANYGGDNVQVFMQDLELRARRVKAKAR